jgi:hypothetical protein
MAGSANVLSTLQFDDARSPPRNRSVDARTPQSDANETRFSQTLDFYAEVFRRNKTFRCDFWHFPSGKPIVTVA